MELRDKKILFLGDSITFGVGVSNPDNIYWRRLAINDGCITKGYGISGTRIAAPFKRSRWPEDDDIYFGTRVESMDADADVIVVFGGTNDHSHGVVAFGKMSDREDTSFYGALHNLMDALRNKYLNAEIVFMTPAHKFGENDPVNSFGDPLIGCLKDYVNAIIEVANYHSLPVLDLYHQWDIDPHIPEIKERYMPDGIHPCDAGHAEIYRYLKAFLESL